MENNPQSYKGFPDSDAYIRDLFARHAAFEKEHAVYLDYIQKSVDPSELESYIDPQEVIEIEKAVKRLNNPKDIKTLRRIGQGDNFAGMKYLIELHNQQVAFKNEIQEVQRDLLRDQLKVIERMIGNLNIYLTAVNATIAEKGSDDITDKVKAALENELDKMAKELTKCRFELAILDKDKQN